MSDNEYPNRPHHHDWCASYMIGQPCNCGYQVAADEIESLTAQLTAVTAERDHQAEHARERARLLLKVSDARIAAEQALAAAKAIAARWACDHVGFDEILALGAVDTPTDEPPMSMIEWTETTLRGRLSMAKARLEGAQGAVDEALAEGRSIDVPDLPRKRGGAVDTTPAETT